MNLFHRSTHHQRKTYRSVWAVVFVVHFGRITFVVSVDLLHYYWYYCYCCYYYLYLWTKEWKKMGKIKSFDYAHNCQLPIANGNQIYPNTYSTNAMMLVVVVSSVGGDLTMTTTRIYDDRMNPHSFAFLVNFGIVVLLLKWKI